MRFKWQRILRAKLNRHDRRPLHDEHKWIRHEVERVASVSPHAPAILFALRMKSYRTVETLLHQLVNLSVIQNALRLKNAIATPELRAGVARILYDNLPAFTIAVGHAHVSTPHCSAIAILSPIHRIQGTAIELPSAL